MGVLPSVRELQQDVRELNQADLPEVDPEENSAEFMGILIKVAYVNMIIGVKPTCVLCCCFSVRNLM